MIRAGQLYVNSTTTICFYKADMSKLRRGASVNEMNVSVIYANSHLITVSDELKLSAFAVNIVKVLTDKGVSYVTCNALRFFSR